MTNGQIPALPTVSVIVPVYNDQANIAKLIESLLAQDYPAEHLEIIIVDNNSSDGTRDAVARYPVKLLQETNIQNSYAARNKGVRSATGEVLAFIDSDCEAGPQWVRQGVATLHSAPADLVGGKVEFFSCGNMTDAQIYDSIMHFRFESTIRDRNATGAGNLFVRRGVFDKVGLFAGHVKSGGDFIWTSKAVRAGFALAYSPKAVVRHSARRLSGLLEKRFRIGTGVVHLQLSQNKPLWRIIAYSVFTILLPCPPTGVIKALKREAKPKLSRKFPALWCIACLCKVAGRLGVLKEAFGVLSRKRAR